MCRDVDLVLLIFIWFPGMENHWIRMLTKATAKLSTLTVSCLSLLLMDLEIIFNYKSLIQNHVFLSISFLLIIFIDQES